MQQTPLVVGNWKMNPQTLSAAEKLFKDVKKKNARTQGATLAIAPPSIYLARLAKLENGGKLRLGIQNVHWEKLGAHTGEISLPMFKSVGGEYAIIGHSERRAAGETDEMVNKKLHAVLKANMIPIVCIGERTRDSHARYYSFVEDQIRKACNGIGKTRAKQIVIAYEPIWAIGTGNNATAGDVHEMKLFIQKILTNLYGRSIAMHIKILYGGSVDEKNAAELYRDGMVHGFLVGGASLKPDSFTGIVKTVVDHG